jgi:transposase InsO family protein
MKDIYLLCNISKQAHHQAVRRQLNERDKEVIYVRLMEQTREIHPGMGLRAMYDLLQPDGIGRDAFIALGLCEGFRLKAVDKQVRTTFSVKAHRYCNLLAGRKFTDVNQIWSSDITYLHCLGKFYYIVLLMDVYSRRIIGYSLSDNMRAERNFEALKMALQLRGVDDFKQQLIHHSDKGSQYASDLYTQTLEDYGIRISMCEEVYENTHVERINDTIKNQYLYRMKIDNEQQLRKKFEEAIKAYNELRPHQSLNKMSPVQYERQLESISIKNRKPMEIFTLKKDLDQPNPNQLKMGFN